MVPVPVFCSAQAVAIATIFCIWRKYHDYMLRREQTMRQRVAYMLWMMAMEVN